MRCRRVLRQGKDYVITCGENIYSSEYLFCGEKRSTVASMLVFFGSYGANVSTKTVEEYASSCALIKEVSKKLPDGTDSIMICLQNVTGPSITFDFGEELHLDYVFTVIKNDEEIIVDHDVGDYESISFDIDSNVEAVCLYNYTDLSDVNLDNAANCRIQYTKVEHSAKWAPGKITFADKQEGVATSLTQRLNIIEGELWYNVKEGLPLFNKNVTISSMDAWIIKTVMKHPDVVNIINFDSVLDNHTYKAEMKVLSKYGELTLQV